MLDPCNCLWCIYSEIATC